MRTRSSTLLLAVHLFACGHEGAANGDTEAIACLLPRCDNPSPKTCACPDDTDGIVTNTAKMIAIPVSSDGFIDADLAINRSSAPTALINGDMMPPRTSKSVGRIVGDSAATRQDSAGLCSAGRSVLSRNSAITMTHTDRSADHCAPTVA
mgnify:CR=1 FL=1